MLELRAWWHSEPQWRGFVLCEGKVPLGARHVFATWLAGFEHRPDEARLPAFDPGRPLSLVPEPDNPHDSGALAVFEAGGNHQAGYVPQLITARLEAVPRFGLSLAEHLRDGERVGLTIVVSREPLSLWAAPRGPDDEATIRRKVKRGKRAFQRAMERWEAAAAAAEDPVEQMRRMLEGFEG
jgi:hypothetical protein